MSKFRPYQEVIVLSFVVNGTRRDVPARFIQYCTNLARNGKVEVEINTVRIALEESQLVDAEEYWKEKNKGKYE